MYARTHHVFNLVSLPEMHDTKSMNMGANSAVNKPSFKLAEGTRLELAALLEK